MGAHMVDALRAVWFSLILSLGLLAGCKAPSLTLIHGHGGYTQHSSGEGDSGESPDENIRESTEQFFRKMHS